jgi:hypothetical protein
MNSRASEDDHMTDLELAAYLDGSLGKADQSRVEDHLASCAECRNHVVSAKALLGRTQPRSRPVFGVAAALAAAAVVAFLLANPRSLQRQRPDTSLIRAESSHSGLTAYTPSGQIPRSNLSFVWGAAPAATAYRLTVTDDGGATIWSVSAVDTTATMPDAIRVVPGKQYYWVVDALAADGSTVSTGLRNFDIRP